MGYCACPSADVHLRTSDSSDRPDGALCLFHMLRIYCVLAVHLPLCVLCFRSCSSDSLCALLQMWEQTRYTYRPCLFLTPAYCLLPVLYRFLCYKYISFELCHLSGGLTLFPNFGLCYFCVP